MLENRATVVQTNEHTAWVLTNQVSGCEQCNGQGCGSSKVAQLFCSKEQRFEVENTLGAEIGEEVIVSVADGAVLRGVALLYAMPLALMVIGGGLAGMWFEQTGQSDAYVAVGGVLGLVLGFVAAKWISVRKVRTINRPFIARRWSDKAQ